MNADKVTSIGVTRRLVQNTNASLQNENPLPHCRKKASWQILVPLRILINKVSQRGNSSQKVTLNSSTLRNYNVASGNIIQTMNITQVITLLFVLSGKRKKI